MTDKIKAAGMTLSPQHAEDALVVEGYGAGGFKMRGGRVSGSMVVTPTGFFPIDVADIADLRLTDFEDLLNAGDKPELVLIGTGAKMQMLPPALKKDLVEAGLGFDPMDTGAAARTFNVLTLEARRVAAVLIAVE